MRKRVVILTLAVRLLLELLWSIFGREVLFFESCHEIRRGTSSSYVFRSVRQRCVLE